MSADIQEQGPAWRPLNEMQRRVAGVLVEKAKTTPDAYPLTLNAITNACNQKSNRFPQMDIPGEDVEVTLDELREMGAVAEIQGGGRVAKYKHRLYEWLGVEKTEIAIMAELLLRGSQTVGELRSRAQRMEPIPDMAALTPLLNGLAERNLVVFLTPAGRGQVVTHGLYQPDELERERANCEGGAASSRQPRAAKATADPSLVDQLAERVTTLEEKMAALEAKLM